MGYVLPDCGSKIPATSCPDRIFIEAQNDKYFFHPLWSLKVFCLDPDFFAENHSGLDVQMKVGMYLGFAWPLYTNWRVAPEALKHYRELSSTVLSYGWFWEVGQQLRWVSFNISHKSSASDTMNERTDKVPVRLQRLSCCVHSVYHSWLCLTSQYASTVTNKSTMPSAVRNMRTGYSSPKALMTSNYYNS